MIRSWPELHQLQNRHRTAISRQNVIQEWVFGRVVEALTYKEPLTHQAMPHYRQIPFYATQQRIVLGNCGLIDPKKMEEYIARGGYEALGKAILEMTQEEVVDTIEGSGLRGRGETVFWPHCQFHPPYAGDILIRRWEQ